MSVGQNKLLPGPITITGVGDQKSVCKDGVYSVRLPLHDGRSAIISGLCMSKITGTFPLYKLEGVERDIHDNCRRIGNQNLVDQLPKLPSVVDGETNILVGIKYAKYFQKKIYKFDNALGIYESVFCSPCGARGVFCLPI